LSDNVGSLESVGASSNEYVSINEGIIVPQTVPVLGNVAFNKDPLIDQLSASVLTSPLPDPQHPEDVTLNSPGGADNHVADVATPSSPTMSDIVLDVMDRNNIDQDHQEIEEEITRMVEEEKAKDNNKTSSPEQASRDQRLNALPSNGETVR
jgi:hypothetical protein